MNNLIIKNLDALNGYSDKNSKQPIETIVIDLKKMSETPSFIELFEKSCEKYEDNGQWDSWDEPLHKEELRGSFRRPYREEEKCNQEI